MSFNTETSSMSGLYDYECAASAGRAHGRLDLGRGTARVHMAPAWD